VLRVREGGYVSVSDGRAAWRWAIVQPDGSLLPCGPIIVEPVVGPAVTVAFAVPKGDRSEWIVQKLTELGVDRIVPFESERTVVRWRGAKHDHHLARLRRIAREAAMQSRRLSLPEITSVATAAEVLAAPTMAVAEPGADPSLDGVVGIAIGPEGGFSAAELAAASRTVGLPGGVLRVDTAAVVAGALLVNLRATMYRQRPTMVGAHGDSQ
jgi:16S rRNA (uracil1498-N3)-methyltransferase